MTSTDAELHARPSGPRDRDAGIDTALERNRAFAAAGGHDGASMFPSLRLLVVTCLDPRVDPAHVLGLELGDAMVIRNGGGRVTPEVIDHIAFVGQLAAQAVPDGPLFEVAVIHHTGCGAAALARDDFRRSYAQQIGADEATLRDQAVVDPATTVASDVVRLRLAEALSPRIAFSGHVYDVATGLVATVVPADRGTAASERT
jgi:carbonic anhydrase